MTRPSLRRTPTARTASPAPSVRISFTLARYSILPPRSCSPAASSSAIRPTPPCCEAAPPVGETDQVGWRAYMLGVINLPATTTGTGMAQQRDRQHGLLSAKLLGWQRCCVSGCAMTVADVVQLMNRGSPAGS